VGFSTGGIPIFGPNLASLDFAKAFFEFFVPLDYIMFLISGV
jgi:hypothetical protein